MIRFTHQYHRAHSCHGLRSWAPAPPPAVSSCCPQPQPLFLTQRYHLVTQRLCSLTPWPTDIPGQTRAWRHKVGCYSRMKHGTEMCVLCFYTFIGHKKMYLSFVPWIPRESIETSNSHFMLSPIICCNTRRLRCWTARMCLNFNFTMQRLAVKAESHAQKIGIWILNSLELKGI